MDNEHSIQSKSSHYIRDGFGFEGSERVPVALPNAGNYGYSPLQEQIVDVLMGQGLELHQADAVIQSLESFYEKLEANFTRLVEVRANEKLNEKLREFAAAMIGTPFDKTPSGRGFRRALLGDCGRSLEQDAKDCRCSPPAIHHHEKSIRARLPHLIKTTCPPKVEGNAPLREKI